MQKKNFVLAALAVVSSVAQAQAEVTVYGAVDVGLILSDNGAPTRSRATSLGSGIMNGSRLGFKGTESLGNGLKARFVLEAGFEADTGVAKSNSGNYASATPASPGGVATPGLFNRRSLISIDGEFGSLALGRDYTPFYYSALDADSMRMGLYANLQEVVFLSGTGAERFGRASNAIFYETPKLSGFTGRVMYALGSEGTGSAGTVPKDANRTSAVSLQYAEGGLQLSGAYQQTKLPVVAGSPAAFTGATWTRTDAIVGFNYAFSDYSVSGGYLRIDQPTRGGESSDAWLGGTVKIGAGRAMLQVQRMRLAPAIGAPLIGKVYGVGYVYPMSKRTVLYTAYGQLNNSATASFSLIANDPTVAPGVPGATVKATAVGVRHYF